MKRLTLGAGMLAMLLCPAALSAVDDDAAEKALRREALKLNEVTGDAQIDEQVNLLRKKPEHAKRLIAAAVALLKEKEKENPFNFNGAYILGSAARDLKDIEAGKTFLRLSIDLAIKLKSDRKVAYGFDELIGLFLDGKKFEEAEKVCKELLELKGGEQLIEAQLQVRLRLAQILARQGKTDEAFKVMEIFKKSLDHPQVLMVHASVLQEAGKYEEAAAAYEKLLEKLNREEAKDFYRQVLANVYTEAGNIDKATEHLQTLLKKDPDNAGYNNDLGYIWADHDRNLPEAEKMIRKAVEKEPERGAYLDSLGWVLFKLKKYEEAKKYLLEATKKEDGQHPEILDHLGDVHMALKEKSEALAAWKKALEAPNATSRDAKRKAEIEKKLKENQ